MNDLASTHEARAKGFLHSAKLLFARLGVLPILLVVAIVIFR